MPSLSRKNANGDYAQSRAGAALHAFNRNSKGQLVYRKEIIENPGASVRVADGNGNALYLQYHIGDASFEYDLNAQGKFIARTT
jgi:hypothetical protein